MSEFSDRIYDVLCEIPKGKVVTYAQVARLAGRPGASRAVGNILHVNPDPAHIPCFRVVNSKGQLAPGFAFGGPCEQKNQLEADGIHVENDKVDLDEYLWRV